LAWCKVLDGRAFDDEQQEHPGPWLDRFGLSALRSLVSWARRELPDITARRGAFIKTRGAVASQ